jgi:translation initiation factor IF-1
MSFAAPTAVTLVTRAVEQIGSSPPVTVRSATAGERSSAIAVKEEKIEMEGEIVESLRSGMFRIRLDNGHEALGYMGGRMKRFRIRVFPGDRVRIELSSYDLTRGRIVYRLS